MPAEPSDVTRKGLVTVAIPVLFEMDPLGPLSHRKGSQPSGECRHTAVVDRDFLSVAHHVVWGDAEEVVADRA